MNKGELTTTFSPSSRLGIDHWQHLEKPYSDDKQLKTSKGDLESVLWNTKRLCRDLLGPVVYVAPGQPLPSPALGNQVDGY